MAQVITAKSDLLGIGYKHTRLVIVKRIYNASNNEYKYGRNNDVWPVAMLGQPKESRLLAPLLDSPRSANSTFLFALQLSMLSVYRGGS